MFCLCFFHLLYSFILIMKKTFFSFFAVHDTNFFISVFLFSSSCNKIWTFNTDINRLSISPGKRLIYLFKVPFFFYCCWADFNILQSHCLRNNSLLWLDNITYNSLNFFSFNNQVMPINIQKFLCVRKVKCVVVSIYTTTTFELNEMIKKYHIFFFLHTRETILPH